MNTPDGQPAWPQEIPEGQWQVYQHVLRQVRGQGLRFAVGGAFALAAYTGRWRNTKDLDLFILPQERQAMVEVLTRCGLDDYYDQLPYDRGWIYRATNGEVIVDAIWAMANQCASVDEGWLSRGPEVKVRGEALRIVPTEEMIWAKLYVLQRERCDWPDVLNLIYAAGPKLDWQHLLDRLAEDMPLLRGVLSVYAWLCPGRYKELPHWLRERLALPLSKPGTSPEVDPARVKRLDSRPWFALVGADDKSPAI
jgi:Nucleotidyl transferase of unknown function (DUF2204)